MASGESSLSSQSPPLATTAALRVKSFAEYKKAKGTQWKALVNKKLDKDTDGKDVQINIGLMEWSDMKMQRKVRRGKN